MLKYLLYLFVTLVVLSGCSGDSEGKNIKIKSPAKKTTVPKKKRVKIKKKPVIKPMITKDSVAVKLTEYGKNHKETIVDIYTTKGKVRIRLYKDTPLHRASFLLMANEGYFTHSVFTRVAPCFIAQGGGTYTKEQTAVSRKT